MAPTSPSAAAPAGAPKGAVTEVSPAGAEGMEKRLRLSKTLCIAHCMFMAAMTTAVPTRAPMVLAIKGGDAAATARTMGLMSSCAAVLELFLNPVFGRLSDKYGRKPFLLFAPVINAILRSSVWVFPKALRVTFVDRMISGCMAFCFMAPINAAMSDMFGTGPQLAEHMSLSMKYYGAGFAIGPFIGAKLGGARAFLASSAMFVLAELWLLINFQETLTNQNKKEFDLAACNPLRFLKLFQNKMLSTLATTIGFQSFGDFVNVYDINFLYLRTVFGYGQAEVGNFFTAVGLSQIAAGDVTRGIIKSAGQKAATLVGNVMWILAMGAFGTSRHAWQLAVSVLLQSFGHQRAVPVGAYLQKHGQVAGLGSAEISAAQGNLTAVLKVFVPILYGNIFAWATSKGRSMPGMPYFLVALCSAVAQLSFASVDPDAAPGR